MAGRAIDRMEAAAVMMEGAAMNVEEMRLNGQAVWPTKALVSITWDAAAISGNKGRNSSQHSVTAHFDDGSEYAVNAGCVFSSDNQAVATVYQGIITFVEYGTATITASYTYAGVTRTATMVASTNDYVVSMSLNRQSATIGIGDTVVLAAVATMYSGATTNVITWSASNHTVDVFVPTENPAVATVMGVSGGNPATVTASCSVGRSDAPVTASCTVTVTGERILDRIIFAGALSDAELFSISVYTPEEGHQPERAAFRVLAVYMDGTTANISQDAAIWLGASVVDYVTLTTGIIPYLTTDTDRVITDGQMSASYSNKTASVTVRVNA